MVTRDPVSRRASAGVPSTSMVVVSVGPRTTSSTAAGVGLSPCRVWSKTSFTASSIHCAFPDEGPPPGISEPGTRVATSTRLSCDLLWDGSIVGTLLDVVANPYTNVHGTNVCLLSSSRCILRGVEVCFEAETSLFGTDAELLLLRSLTLASSNQAFTNSWWRSLSHSASFAFICIYSGGQLG